MPIPTDAPAAPKPARTPSGWTFPAGIILLAAATAAAGALVQQKLGGIALPGCGAGSGCDKATNSAWGVVPGIQWPVSFLGAAYFAALLAAWIAARGRPTAPLRWIARLGALASLMFIGVMASQEMFCKYCTAAHAANLVFVALLELFAPRPARSAPAGMGLAAGLTVFALSSGGLAVAESRVHKNVEQRFDASLAKMKAAAKRPDPAPQPVPTGPTGPTGTPAPTAPTAPVPPAPTAATGVASIPTPPAPQPRGFTGRYRFGPEKAAIRIVMFSGYQCPDCRIFEGQIRQILSQRKDVSFSVKHFPFCTDCNPTPALPNSHPNACWAARAAEAAGILGGNDGFWRMHHWLFDRGGAFTDAEIRAALPGLGFDTERFIAEMTGPETLARIQPDIAEARSLGLMRTPMIFINGVELDGWTAAPNALIVAVNTLAAANPEPATAESDRPPRAGDKYVMDWRKKVAMAWPGRKRSWATGPATAQAKIQVFGDLLEPNTAEVDRILRNAAAGREDVSYEFRYYPFDQSCNPNLPRTVFPGGCRAARAAEAAGQLGGAPAYWAMHEWIMNNQQAVTDANLRAQAQKIGLDPDTFIGRIDSPDVSEVVTNDANIGYRIGIPSIPRIFINGKLVEFWKAPGDFVLERIVEEAATPPAPK